MSDYRRYAWLECYLHAVLETDPDLKVAQIWEAISAVEQRRLSPVESEEELQELARADEGIKALISECGMKLASYCGRSVESACRGTEAGPRLPKRRWHERGIVLTPRRDAQNPN